MNRPAIPHKIPLGLVALFCLLALGAEIAEYQFFAHLKSEKKTSTFNELASIGQLKSSQLSAFLKERRGDSLVLTDLLHVGLAQGWWATKGSEVPALLQQPIASAVAYYGYTGATILDATGNVRYRTGRSMNLSETGLSLARQVVRTSLPPFSELYAADPAVPEQPMLDTFAPIKGTDKTTTVGVLVLRGTWEDLFTMIQTWPGKSRTAEIELIKHDNDQVIVLNELRYRTQTALTRKVPTTLDTFPVVKAAHGRYGPLESPSDYRGHAVLAHIVPVHGTPWSMVVKVDTEEVLEHLQRLQQIAATGTLIAAAGLGLWTHRWQHKREQDRVRHEVQQVELRLAAVIESATDAIITVNEDRHIVLFNPTAERLFGCSAQDALGQPLDRFLPHHFQKMLYEHRLAFNPSDSRPQKIGLLGISSGLRANGQEFPIEASLSQTETDGHTIYTVILRDITERKRAKEHLIRSEAQLKEAQRIAQIGNWELNLSSSTLTWSDELFRIFEIDPGQFGASFKAFLDAVHPEDRFLVNEAYLTSLETHEPYEIIHRLRMADGRIKFIQEHGETHYDEATGRPLRSTGTAQDITALKQAELRIEASLHEKETLLREVHHRVKNNLQIISSLLHFQAKKTRQGQDRSIFSEGQDRLRAMILVHELLYRSTDLHKVPLGEYLKTLTDQLRRSFRESASRTHLRVEAADLSVPATIALPCGMIVTELVTNAFKYAYPDGKSGPVLVRIAARERSFLLSVSDEGSGLPAEFNLEQATSFGLQLVTSLADQLGARLTRPLGIGTEIVLEVPIPSEAMTPEHPSQSRSPILRG
ncbi:MAG: PAS domain S-box protein [Nitrospirota bacterium]|nr:PAS domain S-box protein [Nitrospirota bacterium]MDP2382038.1 PAS domain S-box protein [Nitrospirota bacterium]MDP3595823.1 PAS domain S-box protein [Nitrospirota bacterium]